MSCGGQSAAPQVGQAKRLPGAKSIWISSRCASGSKSARLGVQDDACLARQPRSHGVEQVLFGREADGAFGFLDTPRQWQHAFAPAHAEHKDLMTVRQLALIEDQRDRIAGFGCGLRRRRPPIPISRRPPLRSDAGHPNDLMAARVASSRRSVLVIS